METRYVKPPNLSPSHIGRRLLCHRPMRLGTPRLEIETSGGKVIAHDYGHGGSGLTLAPGSAEYMVKQVAIRFSVEFHDAAQFTVVGGGVIGLFTAYYLLKHGGKEGRP
jgi:D-amino-acid oxidase